MTDNAVTLRKTEPNDYPLLEQWWNDQNVANGARADTAPIPGDAVDKLFHSFSDEDSDHRFGRTILDPNGNPVGHIAAWDSVDPDRNPTMAILIGPYFQDHGYGSQAMKLGIRLAAEQLGAKTITVKVWSFNLRARHMYESLGFKEIDRNPNAVNRDGRSFDEVVYKAPVSRLLDRIAAEVVEREEGEELERRRYEAERPSDLLPVR